MCCTIDVLYQIRPILTNFSQQCGGDQGNYVVPTTYTGWLCMVILAVSAIKCICVVSVHIACIHCVNITPYKRVKVTPIYKSDSHTIWDRVKVTLEYGVFPVATNSHQFKV